jgi:hypothetical protein
MSIGCGVAFTASFQAVTCPSKLKSKNKSNHKSRNGIQSCIVVFDSILPFSTTLQKWIESCPSSGEFSTVSLFFANFFETFSTLPVSLAFPHCFRAGFPSGYLAFLKVERVVTLRNVSLDCRVYGSDGTL